MKRNDANWLGYAEISPSAPVVAGSYGTWTLTYVVGKYGVDDGGRLKVAMRHASDWGVWQMDEPREDNYATATVLTQQSAKVRLEFAPKGYLRPFFKTLVVTVYDGSLSEGDKVVLTFGDTDSGSRGMKAQSFVETQFEFRVAVECFETDVFYEVPGDTCLKVVSAPVAGLLALAESRCSVGQTIDVFLKAEDMFGNPAHLEGGEVEILRDEHVMIETRARNHSVRGEVAAYGAQFTRPGVHVLRFSHTPTGLSCNTNPIQVLQSPAEHRLYWGDFHGQSGYSIGTGSIDEYFRHARDVSLLDFTAHNANDFQVHTEHWEELKQVTKRYHEPGKFVTFLGYEWSGTTPGGGDHNVYTTDDDMTLHRSSHWQVPDKSDEHNDRYPITELYDTLRPLQHKIMVVPHVGGRYANLEFHDPELEPVVEICSCHGRFEWFFEEAIKRGYKTGVVATGDDHTGRPGSSYPTGRAFGVRNGLTAVLSVDRTRQSIWEALKARRCYATSGERILLEFGMRDHHMGEEVLTSTPPEFWVHVVGTAPLHSVEIRRALDSVYSYPLNQDPDPSLIRVAWGGNRLRSRKRYADWSGNLTLTGGKIVSAKGFAFDNPAEGITGWNERSVSWQSHTSGDIDGVIVEVDAPDSARLCFDSPVTKFSLDLSRIRATEQRIDAGGVDLFVSLSTVPRKPNPSEIEATHKDTPPQGVCVPYYVRVMQSDGEMAWSSPIFVTYVPEHRR